MSKAKRNRVHQQRASEEAPAEAAPGLPAVQLAATSQHCAICRHGGTDRFRTIYRGHDAARWTGIAAGASRSISVLVSEAINWLATHPLGDFTFSSNRTLDDLASTPIETPEDLARALPGTSISILLPAGRPDRPELWTRLWRDPRGGLSGFGRPGLFVETTLPDTIRRFFDGLDCRGLENGRFVAPAELWIRRGWEAAALVQDAGELKEPAPITERSPAQRAHAAAVRTVQRRIERNAAARRNEDETKAAVEKSAREWDERRTKGRG